MIINHNMAAMNTHRQLGSNNAAAANNIEKLSSGLKINRAGDDAAGLAISEKMRGQIRGLDMAQKNSQDGISLIQTAEGALNETHDILQRMRELAVQSSNDTNTKSDRGEIQKELNELTNEIDRIANTTEFNTQKLLNGDKAGLRAPATGTVGVDANTAATVTATAGDSDALTGSGTITITRTATDKAGASDTSADFTIGDPSGKGATFDGDSGELTGFGDAITVAGFKGMQVGESITISVKKNDAGNDVADKALSFQIGANSGQNILVGIDDMRAEALGVRATGSKAGLDISDAEKATAAITTINNAIETVSSERSKLGATQNRLEHTINNLGTSSENLTAAESRIRDVDYVIAA